MLKIAYIGRDAMLQKIISEKGYVKHDFYYTSIQDNHFSAKSELEKLYALRDITLLVMDIYCIEEQSEVLKNLIIFKTIRSYTEIIVLTDRKLYSDDFEVLYFPSNDNREMKLEEKSNLTSKLNSKIFSMKNRKTVTIKNEDSKKEKNKKIKSIIDFKKFSMPQLLLRKDTISEHKMLKPLIDVQKLQSISFPSIKTPKINIPKIKKIHFFKKKKNTSIGCKVQKKIFSKEKSEEKIDILLKKINIFTSGYHLQGISFMIHSLKEQEKNCAVLDLNYSYISYTKYDSIEQYITETLILPEFLEKKDEDIYTVPTPISSEDLQKVIQFLSREYEHILIDTSDNQIYKTIPEAMNYYVVTEDFALLKQLKCYEKEIEGTVIVNRYTNTIDREEFSFLNPIFINEMGG